MILLEDDWLCLLLIGPVSYYCETHKTVNTRNINEMLLCSEKIDNKVWEN